MKIKNVVLTTTAGESWLERVAPPSPLCAVFNTPAVQEFAAPVMDRRLTQQEVACIVGELEIEQ